MPQRAKDLTVHNGATHNLGIGFDDEVQGKPTQSDSYELLVWRSQTTDLPFLAGEDFLDIHAWWNVMAPVARNNLLWKYLVSSVSDLFPTMRYTADVCSLKHE